MSVDQAQAGSADTSLPAPNPVITPETREFWEAAERERLVLQRCPRCEEFIWYPRSLCPGCMSTQLEWVGASGRGVVYSYSVVRHAEVPEYAPATPYLLAYVELEEGPVVLTNLVDCTAEEVKIGDSVRAVFHHTGEGTALMRFALDPTRNDRTV
jgi:uncharacterized OB-fold protein